MSRWRGALEGGASGGLATGFNPWGVAGGALLGFLGGGDDKASKDAMKAQLQMQKLMYDMYQKQQEVEMPYRKGLFEALAARQKAPMPQFLPRKPTSFNPMAMRNRLRAPISRPAMQNAPSGGLFEAIQASRQKAASEGATGGRFAQPQGPERYGPGT